MEEIVAVTLEAIWFGQGYHTRTSYNQDKKVEIQMGDFDALFESIMSAKPVGNFLPRLPVGQHLLAVKRYNGKHSDMGAGIILEADLAVLKSSTLAAGELRGWAWFPQSSGLSGQYEAARVNEFLSAIGAGVGDTSPTKVIGGRLVDGTYVGIQIMAVVSPSLEKDGVTAKRSKKTGAPMFNISWSAVPGQTADSVQQVRAHISSLGIQAAPAAAPAPAPQAAPIAAPQAAPAAAPAGFGGFAQAAAPATAAPTGGLAEILAGLNKGRP